MKNNKNPRSKETREKIAKSRRNKTVNEMGHKVDCKCFICKAKRGETKGFRFTQKSIDKRIETKKKIAKERGYWVSDKGRENMRLNHADFKGKKCHFYIDGRTEIHLLIRHLKEHSIWRTKIFQRDNYTCQECGKTECYVEAHHKKRFSILMQNFLNEYNQFSPIEDKETLLRLAIKWKPFWDINNGKTLCKDCHNKTKGKRKVKR